MYMYVYKKKIHKDTFFEMLEITAESKKNKSTK